VTPSRQPELSRGVRIFSFFTAKIFAEVHSALRRAREHDHFVKAIFGSFATGPNIIEPEASLRRREESGVAAVFAEGQAHDFAMFGKTAV